MSIDSITENPLTNAGGKTAFLATVFMNAWNWLADSNINQILVIATSTLGIFYMSLKIYKIIIEIKRIKKTDRDSE